MAHTVEDQRLLDSMSDREKLMRTSLPAFRKRKGVEMVFKYWFLTRNEMPHDDVVRGFSQYILWERHLDGVSLSEKYLELSAIRELDLGHADFLSHSSRRQSVRSRRHWHVLIPDNTEDVI